MKERIKKFWNDRKDREKIVIVGGTALAAYVVALIAFNKDASNEYGVANVWSFNDENNVNRILVSTTDGRIHSFHKPPITA